MRKIAATYIFPANRTPIKNGIIVCDDNGTIIDLKDNNGVLKEESGLEYYNGILVPGFVNTHCHLELSHIKGKIEEKTGLTGFISRVRQLKAEEPEIIAGAVKAEDRKMEAAGIVAVGDISNSFSSIQTKTASKISYHTFIEVFGLADEYAEKTFDNFLVVLNEFRKNNLRASLVPHSPYSLSKKLFEKVKTHTQTEETIISVHNQESRAESQLFETRTGPFVEFIKNIPGADISKMDLTEKSSLLSMVKYLPPENQLILVHNTFTKKNDLTKLWENRSPENTYFALCPNSNLYIENALPPVSMFRNEGLNICIGTDSLSSNHKLSVLAEMVTIQQNFDEISLNEIVEWATINGAKALKMENKLGSFEESKTPGINLITGIDFKNMKLTANSKVKKII